MAGREIPSSVPSWNIDIAISAPVLPAEIATSASLVFTESMARHIEVLRPRRSARLGFSSMRTRSGAWRMVTRSSSLARLANSALSSVSSPWRMNLTVGWRRTERASAATTTPGPASPPMASIETVSSRAKPASLSLSDRQRIGSGFGLRDFAAVIVATGAAHMVRTLLLAAVRAFIVAGRSQTVVRPTHVAPGRRRFFSLAPPWRIAPSGTRDGIFRRGALSARALRTGRAKQGGQVTGNPHPVSSRIPPGFRNLSSGPSGP